MTNHTPGPWHYESDGNPVDHHTFKPPGYYDNLYLVGPNGEHIAGCEEYAVFGKAEDRALIAAAPELLEALKRAIQSSGFHLSGPTHPEVAVDEGEPRWVALARAAIAKAEGRTE